MKYKKNNQWQVLYVKAMDSMPVGTVVDFDGQASNIPVGWTQIGSSGQLLTIKKTSETTPYLAQIVNMQNDSTTNGYSCNYVNNVIKDFITNTVDDLVNYYKKSETYTQAEVNSLIGAISTMTIQVVQTLPTQDISTTTIYLVPRQTSETQNVYDEYIYVSNNWEKIGTTDIDLSNYYTKTQVDNLILPIGIWNNQTQGKSIAEVIGNWSETNARYEDYEEEIQETTSTITLPLDIASVDFVEANGEEVSPEDYTFSGKTMTFNTPLQAGSYLYVGYYSVPESMSSIIGNWVENYTNPISNIVKSVDDRVGNWNTLQNGQNISAVIGTWRSKYSTTSIKDKINSIDTSISGLSTVATTGNYNDLNGTPNLATVATTGAYSDLSGTPTIGDATITFTQGGVTKGSITTNQTSNATIALDSGGSDLPSQTGNSGKFLKTNGTNASWDVATKVTIRSW